MTNPPSPGRDAWLEVKAPRRPHLRKLQGAALIEFNLKHPRDRKGRFIETGGIARMWGGMLVRVLGMGRGANGRPMVRVEDRKGRTRMYDPGKLTMVARPDGSKPTASKTKVQKADADRDADPLRPNTDQPELDDRVRGIDLDDEQVRRWSRAELDMLDDDDDDPEDRRERFDAEDRDTPDFVASREDVREGDLVLLRDEQNDTYEYAQVQSVTKDGRPDKIARFSQGREEDYDPDRWDAALIPAEDVDKNALIDDEHNRAGGFDNPKPHASETEAAKVLDRHRVNRDTARKKTEAERDEARARRDAKREAAREKAREAARTPEQQAALDQYKRDSETLKTSAADADDNQLDELAAAWDRRAEHFDRLNNDSRAHSARQMAQEARQEKADRAARAKDQAEPEPAPDPSRVPDQLFDQGSGAHKLGSVMAYRQNYTENPQEKRDLQELATRWREGHPRLASQDSLPLDRWLNDADQDEVRAFVDRLQGTARGSVNDTYDEMRRMGREIAATPDGDRWHPTRRREREDVSARAGMLPEGERTPDVAATADDRTDRRDALADVPADPVGGDEPGRAAGVRGRPGRAGETDNRGADTGVRTEPERRPDELRGTSRGDRPGQGSGAGAGDAGDRVPSPGAGSEERRALTESQLKRRQDAPRFRPQSQDDLAPKGKRAKAKANIEALRTLRTLQDEDRAATPDEQRRLARWSGWGSIAQEMFSDNPRHQQEYAAERAALAELLTPQEREAALDNTINAHYTDADIVDAVWDAARDLGFTGGSVIEPGSGSGNFIGRAPADADLVGVELEPITAAISQHLYPDATIRAQSYADFEVPDGTFDLAIGNVPFSRDLRLVDRAHNPGRRMTIHNHFINKAIDQTRPGGLVAVVTSAATMDSKDRRHREAFYDKADLVGAIRLPNGAHENAAGTNVVTDLLIFRRRPAGEKPRDGKWVHSEPRMADGEVVHVNPYWTRNPDRVLGRMSVVGKGAGTSVSGVRVDGDTDNVGDNIRRAMRSVVRDAHAEGLMGTPSEGRAPAAVHDLLGSVTDRNEGNITYDADGDVFTVVEHGRVTELHVPKARRPEMKLMVGLRDKVFELLNAEAASDDDTPQIRKLRKELNTLHDRYTRRYGAASRTRWRASNADHTFKKPKTVAGGDLEAGAVVEVPGQWAQGGKPRRAFVTDIGDDGRITAQLIGKPERGPDEKDKSITLDATRSYTQTGTRTITHTQVSTTPPIADRDPTMAVVRALDMYDIHADPEGKGKEGWAKASIFTKRAVKAKTRPDAVDSPADALRLARNETGRVDLDRVGQLLGVPPEQVPAALGDAVFDDPDGAGWVTSEEYLSGDTRAKLAAARLAAAKDGRFSRNVEALEAVTPADLGPEDVDARLGSVWIEQDTVKEFLAAILNDPDVDVLHLGGTRWLVEPGQQDLVQSEGTWGTTGRNAYKLAENLLTGRPIRLTKTVDGPDGSKKSVQDIEGTKLAQAKADEMARRFKEWLWEDPARADALLTRYNNLFNSVVPRDYDTSRYDVEGLADGWTLKPHQAAAVRRIVSERAALLAHDVGAGKTLAMASAAMELRRLGLANKPSIVVPNHMKEQFTREFLQSYPQAKLLAASTEDLKTPQRRADFMAKVATGDWDAVILTQTAFEKIPMSKDSQRAYLEKEVALLELQLSRAAAHSNDPDKDRTVKDLRRKLAARRQKLLDKITKQEDKGLTFEQTGIDYLFVDEAHEYKNLEVQSTLRDASIQGADKATDLHMKVDYLQEEKPDGPTVTFATATPVANAVAESYTLMRYLRPDMLRAQGIEDFDSWRNTFGEITNDFEMSPTGAGYRQKPRLASFKNTPEMLRSFHAVADVQSTEDLDLDIPDIDGGAPEPVMVDADSWLLDVKIPELQARAENLGAVDPSEDNMLKIMGEARGAALDPRLVGGPEPENGGKIRKAAQEIAAIYEETKDNEYGFPGDVDRQGPAHPTKGALQIVFSDLGTPGGRSKKTVKVLDEDGNEVEVETDDVADDEAGLTDFNVYDELKRQLVELGIPEHEIAYMQDAKGKDAKKAELFRRASTGEIKVLIGSTKLMGVGTNVQHRAVAIHHMEPPWRPADVQQRDGRVIRQLNQNSVVRVKQYGTKGSLDSLMWQTLERKGRFIAQMMRGNLEDREFEDIGQTTLTAAEMKAATSGDMTMMHKARTDALVNKLEVAKSAWRHGQANAKFGVDMAVRNIRNAERDEAAYDAAIPMRVLDGDLLGGMPFTIGGRGNKDFENPTELNEWVRDQVLEVLKSQKMMGDGEKTEIGEIAGGFKVYAQSLYDHNRGRGVAVWVAGIPHSNTGWLAAADVQSRQWFQRWGNMLDGLEEHRAKAVASRDYWQHKKRAAESNLGKEFTQADELEAALKRKARLDGLVAWVAGTGRSEDDKEYIERWKKENPEAAQAGGTPPPPPELIADDPEIDRLIGGLEEADEVIERTPSKPLRNIDDRGEKVPRDNDYLRRSAQGKTGVNRPGRRKGRKPSADGGASGGSTGGRSGSGGGESGDGGADRPRNPRFGKPAAEPELRRYGSARAGHTSVVQKFHGRYEDSTPIERTHYTVSREEGVWSAYKPQQQVPDRSFGTRREAEDWALDRAKGVPDPDAPEADEPTLLDQDQVADTIEDLGGDRPEPRTPEAPEAPDAADLPTSRRPETTSEQGDRSPDSGSGSGSGDKWWRDPEQRYTDADQISADMTTLRARLYGDDRAGMAMALRDRSDLVGKDSGISDVTAQWQQVQDWYDAQPGDFFDTLGRFEDALGRAVAEARDADTKADLEATRVHVAAMRRKLDGLIRNDKDSQRPSGPSTGGRDRTPDTPNADTTPDTPAAPEQADMPRLLDRPASKLGRRKVTRQFGRDNNSGWISDDGRTFAMSGAPGQGFAVFRRDETGDKVTVEDGDAFTRVGGNPAEWFDGSWWTHEGDAVNLNDFDESWVNAERYTDRPDTDTTPDRPVLDENNPAAYLDASTQEAVDADPDVAEVDTDAAEPAPNVKDEPETFTSPEGNESTPNIPKPDAGPELVATPVRETPDVPPTAETPDTRNTPAGVTDEPWRDPQNRYGRTGVGAAAEQADWQALRDMVGRGNDSIQAKAVLDRPDLVGDPDAGLTRFPAVWNDVVKPDVADRSGIPYETRADRLDNLARVLDQMMDEAQDDGLREQLDGMVAQAQLMRAKAANAAQWENARRMGQVRNPRPTPTPTPEPQQQADTPDTPDAPEQPDTPDQADADEAEIVDARGAEGQMEGQQALGGGTDSGDNWMLQEVEPERDGPREVEGQTDIFGQVADAEADGSQEVPEAPTYPFRDQYNPSVVPAIDDEIRRNIADGAPYPELHTSMSYQNATLGRYLRQLADQYDGVDAEALRHAGQVVTDRTRKSPADLARELVRMNDGEKHRKWADLDAVIDRTDRVADALERAVGDKATTPTRKVPVAQALREHAEAYREARRGDSVGGEGQDVPVPESDRTPDGLVYDEDVRYVHVDQWDRPKPDDNTVVWNAPRPLVGADMWEGGFVSGIFYASARRDDPNFERWAELNRRDGAVEVRVVNNAEVLQLHQSAAEQRGDKYTVKDYLDNDLSPAEAMVAYNLPWSDGDDSAEPLLARLREGDTAPDEAPEADAPTPEPGRDLVSELPGTAPEADAAPTDDPDDIVDRARDLLLDAPEDLGGTRVIGQAVDAVVGSTRQGQTPDEKRAGMAAAADQMDAIAEALRSIVPTITDPDAAARFQRQLDAIQDAAAVLRGEAREDRTPEPDVTPDEAPEPAAAGGGEQPPRTPPVEVTGPDPDDPHYELATQRVDREEFDPTPEQADIYAQALAGGFDNMVVNAKAGTGKTTTLEGLARRIAKTQPNAHILYVAFNKSVQTEAEGRMPGNTESRTGHSLAFTWVSDAHKSRLRKGEQRVDAVARILGITRDLRTRDGGSMSRTEQAMAAKKTVERFAVSADDEIGPEHLPDRARTDLDEKGQAELVAHARAYWADVSSDTGQLFVTNDHQRKMWALSRPDLSKTGGDVKKGANIIFLDEAQDTPPVLAKVIADQTVPTVIVGDQDQAIYGSFTGSIDYMAQVDADKRGRLSKSFRFGPETADAGNRFLQLLDSPDRVRGDDDKTTVLEEINDPDAILTRTNAGMLASILEQQELGRVVGVPKGTKGGLIDLVESARYLMGEGPAPRNMHEELAPFRTWDEVKKAANSEDEDNRTLKMLYGIIDQYGVDGLDQIVSQVMEMGDDPLAGVTFTDTDDGIVVGGKTWGLSERLKKETGRTLSQFGFKAVYEKGAGRGGRDKFSHWINSGTPEQQERTMTRLREWAASVQGDPDVVVSTAHKSKGLEWDRVKIGEDFFGPREDKQTGEEIMPDDEELRLAYVAVTRAKKALDVGSLEWVYGKTDPNGGVPGRRDRTPEAPTPDVTPDVTPEASTIRDEPDVPTIDEGSTDEQVADALDEVDEAEAPGPEVLDTPADGADEPDPPVLDENNPAGFLDAVTEQAEADDPDLVDADADRPVLASVEPLNEETWAHLMSAASEPGAGFRVSDDRRVEVYDFDQADQTLSDRLATVRERMQADGVPESEMARLRAANRGLVALKSTLRTTRENVEARHLGDGEQPEITDAKDHYGFPTVWVKPYRAVDRITGSEVQVDQFIRNGGLLEASGFKVRKNGELHARRTTLDVDVPENVAARLAELSDADRQTDGQEALDAPETGDVEQPGPEISTPDTPAAPVSDATPPAPEPELVATPVRRTPRANNDRVVDVTRDGDVYGTVEAVMDPNRPKKVDHHRVLRGDTEVGTLHKAGKSRHRAQRADGTWVGTDGSEDGAKRFESRNAAALALLEDAGHTTPESRGDVPLPEDTTPDETPEPVEVADVGVATPPDLETDPDFGAPDAETPDADSDEPGPERGRGGMIPPLMPMDTDPGDEDRVAHFVRAFNRQVEAGVRTDNQRGEAYYSLEQARKAASGARRRQIAEFLREMFPDRWPTSTNLDNWYGPIDRYGRGNNDRLRAMRLDAEVDRLEGEGAPDGDLVMLRKRQQWARARAAAQSRIDMPEASPADGDDTYLASPEPPEYMDSLDPADADAIRRADEQRTTVRDVADVGDVADEIVDEAPPGDGDLPGDEELVEALSPGFEWPVDDNGERLGFDAIDAMIPDDEDGAKVRAALNGEYGDYAQQAAILAAAEVWDGAPGEAWLAAMQDLGGPGLPPELRGEDADVTPDVTPDVVPDAVPEAPAVREDLVQTVAGLDEYGDPIEVEGEIIDSRAVVVNMPWGKAKWTQHTVRTRDGQTVKVLSDRDTSTPPVPPTDTAPDAAAPAGVRRGMRVTDGTRQGRVTDMIGDRAAVRWDDGTTSNEPSSSLEEATGAPSGGGITVGTAEPGSSISIPGTGTRGTVTDTDGDGELVVTDTNGVPHRVDVDPDVEVVDGADSGPVEVDAPGRPVDDGGLDRPRTTNFGALSDGDDIEVDGVRGTLTARQPMMVDGQPGSELTIVDAAGQVHTRQVTLDTPIDHHSTGGGAAVVEALERAHTADPSTVPADIVDSVDDPDDVDGLADDIDAATDDRFPEPKPGEQAEIDLGLPELLVDGKPVNLSGSGDPLAGLRGLTPEQVRDRLTTSRLGTGEGVREDGTVEGWRLMQARLDRFTARRMAQSARDARPFPGESKKQAAQRMKTVLADQEIAGRLAESLRMLGHDREADTFTPSGTPAQQRRWWQRQLPTDRDKVGTRRVRGSDGVVRDRVDVNPDGTPGEVGAQHVRALQGSGAALADEVERGVAGTLAGKWGENPQQLMADLEERVNHFGALYRRDGDDLYLRQWQLAKDELEEARGDMAAARTAVIGRALEVLRVMGVNNMRLDGPDDRLTQVRQAERMLPADWTLDRGRWLTEISELLGRTERVRSKRWRLAKRLGMGGQSGDARSAMIALADDVQRQNKPIAAAMRVFNARRVQQNKDVLSLGTLLDMLYTAHPGMGRDEYHFALGLLSEM